MARKNSAVNLSVDVASDGFSVGGGTTTSSTLHISEGDISMTGGSGYTYVFPESNGQVLVGNFDLVGVSLDDLVSSIPIYNGLEWTTTPLRMMPIINANTNYGFSHGQSGAVVVAGGTCSSLNFQASEPIQRGWNAVVVNTRSVSVTIGVSTGNSITNQEGTTRNGSGSFTLAANSSVTIIAIADNVMRIIGTVS